MILTGDCDCGQKLEFDSIEIPLLKCPKCARPLKDQIPSSPASVPRSQPGGRYASARNQINTAMVFALIFGILALMGCGFVLLLNLTLQNLLIFTVGVVVAVFLYVALLILERTADAAFDTAERQGREQ